MYKRLQLVPHMGSTTDNTFYEEKLCQSNSLALGMSFSQRSWSDSHKVLGSSLWTTNKTLCVRNSPFLFTFWQEFLGHSFCLLDYVRH